MFAYPNGSRLIGRSRNSTRRTQAPITLLTIYEHLKQGRLVIDDQSSGNPEINNAAADRVIEVDL